MFDIIQKPTAIDRSNLRPVFAYLDLLGNLPKCGKPRFDLDLDLGSRKKKMTSNYCCLHIQTTRIPGSFHASRVMYLWSFTLDTWYTAAFDLLAAHTYYMYEYS